MISIVVPVYREENNISKFITTLLPIMDGICSDFEVIFAMDPSPDNTEKIINQLHHSDKRIKLVKFSRRFGQPMATIGGLAYSSGQAVIVMDVDLQDPPSLIPELVQKWREGYDVVIPKRISRTGEPLLKKIIVAIGYKIISLTADVPIEPNTGDYRLMSRRVVQEVIKLSESHGFLRGMVAVVGFNKCIIPFNRPKRYAGVTKYNKFLGSLRIGFNGIFGFSTYALKLSTILGFIIAGSAFIVALIYLILKLSGFNFPVGNPTLVILILLLGGIQLICVGILGEYIGRIYDEVRQRPKFIVDYSKGFE